MPRTLYWGSGSAPAWRVQVALAEKKLPYDSKMIEFSKQGHKAPEVLALNPRGQVPTFVDDDGTIVNESLAAVLYLDARYKGQGTVLVPDGAAAGAVLQRTFEAANLHTAMRDVIYPKMRGIDVPADQAAAKLDALRGELARWDAYVSSAGGGDWLTGPDFTAADVAVGPLLLAIQRFGAKLDVNTPALAAYAGRVAARPSVAATWPPHWKEGEGPGFLKEV